MTNEHPSLHQLATEAGVLTAYHDGHGKLLRAKPEVLLRVLQLLGVAIERAQDAPAALVAEQRRSWRRSVAPCAVAWDGHVVEIPVRLPAEHTGAYQVELTLESGEIRGHQGHLGDISACAHATIDGISYVQRNLRVPVGALGYHRADVQVAGPGHTAGSCHVISAPTTGYLLPTGKRWGVFAPMYALRGERPSGAGDLGDLERLARWAHGLGAEPGSGRDSGHGGAEFVGTLPLLATFLDEPFEPSPYSPASRLFWNELYIDLDTAPGLELSPDARAVLGSASFMARARELDALELVDYRAQMAHKRGVLEALAGAAWASDALRRDIEAFMGRKPRVDDYARFRAVTAAQGKVWSEWPEPLRSGTIKDRDFDDRVRRYHVYVQYAMDVQLSRLDGRDAARLYLDVPVGLNRAGYDVWRDRDAFVLGAAAGAPPDALFSSGQNWGLPPLHPHHLRERGYRYFIDTIRHHTEHAGLVRIDHAMGLHRLFWIPDGAATRDGVYVHYAAGEMYAVISLESHRHECAVTGEDLGTVPDYVRPAMRHHGLSRLYVAQFSLPEAELVSARDSDTAVDSDGSTEAGVTYGVTDTVTEAATKAATDAATGATTDATPDATPDDGRRRHIDPAPAESVASLNTHDLPTFHGYWHGRDIDDFHELGLLDADEAVAARAARRITCRATVRVLVEAGFLAPEHAPGDAAGQAPENVADDRLLAIMRALLEYLAAGDAHMLMVTMEDLWLAPLAHNVPGTTHERPNWRRRMAYRVSEVMADERIEAILRAVAARRRS